MKKSALFICLGIIGSISGSAQINAGLFRYPDVSKTKIVFTYANDLWVMPKEGGMAVKLSSTPGVETSAKFSPDGNTIAFNASYDGNRDVYTMPVSGGVPQRITAHGYNDRVVDWSNDGKQILFASSRESGKARFNQFYLVPATGGVETKLPLAYAEYGSYSPDAKQMAVVIMTQVGRNWKRYRGGTNGDIRIYDFAKQTEENISANSDAGDEFPMWHEQSIYFLSDRGADMRMNLWKYDTQKKNFEQLTKFTDYDVHFPSQGPDDIVFEAGGKLFLFPFATQQPKEIKVSIISDRALLKSKTVSVADLAQHFAISADGKRVLVEARGDIFSVPAENGFVKNITMSSGIAERYPSWSPDGRTIAYWSDKSGEYELWVIEQGKDAARKLTSYGAGYRYGISFSPNSKQLAFIDKAGKVKLFDIASGVTSDIDQGLYFSHGNMEGFTFSWSVDSRWLAYSRDLENLHNAVFIYDTKEHKTNQVTNGYYSCNNPVFSVDGKYLFVTTNQTFQPYYSDADNTFIYANSTQLAAIGLQKNAASILFAKNDTVALKDLEKQIVKEDPKKDAKKKDDKIKPADAEKKADVAAVLIDFEGLENRLELLPVPAGNIGALGAIKGKLLYLRSPNTGVANGKSTIKFYDIDKREEKTILTEVDGYVLSANNEKMLVAKSGAMAVVSPEESAKFDKPLRLNEMQMTVDPMIEWKQIFNDAWRIERDYFYDGNMHGVNWVATKDKYAKILEGATTREELDFVIGEMIGELNSSHTYHGGGDFEKVKSEQIGYIGVNWEAVGTSYKIKKIIRGANWDAEIRSPLERSGSDIKEGDYILAVNGIPITTETEPYVAFQGLANKTVELSYNSTASQIGAKTATIKTIDDEYRLRNLEWIEGMRKRVEEATNGDVGYIYVPSTGLDGQSELMRQFNAQWNKKALIIDERFNNGGQIPDRFIEMLNRSPLSYVATRDGKPWQFPGFANFGPKVMLINGWSGSGGDAFPDYFRKKNLGPLIGSRTWGGLIGISGYPEFIDGGNITAPSFRLYNPDGTWFKEGHGVDPDIEVEEDLGAMAKGIDPQLERAIVEIKNLLKIKEFKAPPVPVVEKRN